MDVPFVVFTKLKIKNRVQLLVYDVEHLVAGRELFQFKKLRQAVISRCEACPLAAGSFICGDVILILGLSQELSVYCLISLI